MTELEARTELATTKRAARVVARANRLVEKGRLAAAIGELDRAAAIAEELPEAALGRSILATIHSERAMLFAKLGRRAEAKAALAALGPRWSKVLSPVVDGLLDASCVPPSRKRS